MAKLKKTYTPLERNMYLLGMLGQNMLYNIIGTGLTYYYQSVIFIPAVASGVIFAIAKVWDAINDPMMGSIIDKTRSKWGKCKPYLLFCPAVICLISCLCFANGIYRPENSSAQNAGIIIWAAIGYILWGMSYTVGDIPLWGVTSLMTEDENDRSKLLSLARIAAGIGGGVVMLTITSVSTSVGTKLSADFGEERGIQYGFIIVSVVLTIIGSALFQLTGIFVKEKVPQSSETHTFAENFKIMWSNKPYRRILISSVLRAPIQLLTLVAMTLVSYYYGDFYGNYMLYLIILGGAIFGAQFISMAVTPIFIKKFEKKSIYNVTTIIGAVSFALIFVVYKLAPTKLMEPFWIAVCFLIFAAAGAGMGALNVLQSVMIADAVDYEEYTNGIRPDGIFFSGQSFSTKLGSGISSLIQSAVFFIVGFSDKNVQAVNAVLAAGGSFKQDYPEYASAMFFLCAIPPAIGLILSVIPMRNYELSNKRHAEILDALIERRGKNNNS